MRLRLDFGYDGTDFHGWAMQPALRTVQGELEAALSVLLGEAQTPRLTVAGRTDAGVHARRQVAHLDVVEDQARRVTARRLNGVLARLREKPIAEILVHDVSEVSEAFDARFSAVSRRYQYRLWSAEAQRDVLNMRFTAEVPSPLNLELMRAASAELTGLRDFTSFCKAREGSTAVRELQIFEWIETADGAYAATLQADAFCHSMVRALVGAVVAVGSQRITLQDLVRIRDDRARTSHFTVMPAHGLTLEEVVYPEADELAVRAEQTRARRDPLPQEPRNAAE